jgi:hypothetical protein
MLSVPDLGQEQTFSPALPQIRYAFEGGHFVTGNEVRFGPKVGVPR